MPSFPYRFAALGWWLGLLVPWLVLRRWLHRALAAAAVGLAGLLFAGDRTEFLQLVRSQQFPWVVGFDFFALSGGASLLWLERRLQP